jgi:hypothetical protein
MQTTVMLMTDSHRIFAQMNTGGERLQDLLNNKLNTCIQLYDAQIFPQAGATAPLAHFPEMTVSKLLLNLVLFQEDKYEAPTKRLYGFVAKNSYETFLTVSGYEVQGHLHFASLPRPEIFLTDTITSFVPVTQATVTCTQEATRSWSTSVAFVRRQAIALFRAVT